jgi:hypothetical protein
MCNCTSEFDAFASPRNDADQNFRLDSVDRIFTILFERLFTNAFDVIGADRAGACVYRAGNAD